MVLPGVLRGCAGGAGRVAVRAGTLRDVLDGLAADLPVLERRLRDEQGVLRQYVLIFVDGIDVRHAAGLDTAVTDGAELYVAPSIAGG